MSSPDAPGRRNARQAVKSPTLPAPEWKPPAGFEIDHYDPDIFVLRCTDCGPITWVQDREQAHEASTLHTKTCSQTAINPVSQTHTGYPLIGQCVTIQYESERTGSELVCGGPVIGSRQSPDGHKVEIDDRNGQSDRLVVMHFDGSDATTVTSRNSSGSTILGEVLEFQKHPIDLQFKRSTTPFQEVDR